MRFFYIPAPLKMSYHAMKLKTIATITCFGWLAFSMDAQSKIEPEVIASSGQHLQNSNLRLDFTLGEFMVQDFGTDPKLTQGFHQPGLEFIIRTIDPSLAGKIKIFPNPSTEFLNIVIKEEGIFNLTLYDLRGVFILEKEFSSSAQLDLGYLMPGFYALRVTKNTRTVFSGVFVIIK